MVKLDRIGVVPYLYNKGKLRFVLVNSRDGDRWVLPKGKPEPDLGRRELAALEAWEEAGIRGRWERKSRVDVRLQQGGRKLRLRLYPMLVEHLASRWPEHRERERRVVGYRRARRLLCDRGMERAVRDVRRRLRTS